MKRPSISNVAILAAAAACLSPAGAARAGSLGLAGDYNLFVLNDATKSNVDVQGKVAVGRDAKFTNYTVGSSLGSNTTNLVVGRNLSETNATIKGNVVAGGNATFTNPTITGKLSANGNVQINGGGGTIAGGTVHGGTFTGPAYYTHSTGTTPIPLNFSAIGQYLNDASGYWGSLAPTGSTVSQYGGVTMTGGNSSLNIFNVNASMLSSSWGLTINAPSTSTVLVNIFGATSSMNNMGLTLNGVNLSKVLYNFVDATTVGFSGIGIKGTVLAPKANVTFNNGAIDGSMIAYNYMGNGEEHLHLFDGVLPDYTPPAPNAPVGPSVPAPGAALGGLTLIGALFTTRRFKARE